MNGKKAELFERQGGRCAYCGRLCRPDGNQSHSFTIDHDHPRARGGPNSYLNRVGACWDCNHDKANMTGEEYRLLLAARSGPLGPARLCFVYVARPPCAANDDAEEAREAIQ